MEEHNFDIPRFSMYFKTIIQFLVPNMYKKNLMYDKIDSFIYLYSSDFSINVIAFVGGYPPNDGGVF